jgi:hypothetical protein
MKESFIDCGRAIVANDQTAKVSEPGKGALHFPTAPIAAQRSTVLGARLAAIPTMRRDQFDPACRQPLAQWIAVVGAIGNHTLGFLTWPSTALSPAHTNRRERFFREPDFVGRCRVKLLSQRNTLAVDHHHPLRGELIALVFTLTTINAWNRLAITMRTEVGNYQPKARPVSQTA